MKKITIVNKTIGKEADFFLKHKQEVLSRRQVELLKDNLSIPTKENGNLDYSKVSAYEFNCPLHIQSNLGIDKSGYFPTLQVYYY